MRTTECKASHVFFDDVSALRCMICLERGGVLGEEDRERTTPPWCLFFWHALFCFVVWLCCPLENALAGKVWEGFAEVSAVFDENSRRRERKQKGGTRERCLLPARDRLGQITPLASVVVCAIAFGLGGFCVTDTRRNRGPGIAPWGRATCPLGVGGFSAGLRMSARQRSLARW